MLELAQAWEQRLIRDLSGFADRGVEPVVEREETTLEVSWTARGRERSELFGLNAEGSLRWLSAPSGEPGYSEFLRSETMGDFSQLAAATGRAIPRLLDFVPSDARVDSGAEATQDVSATPALLAELADQGRLQAEGRTSLFFVKGDPGAGKTTLLREATSLQAQRYLDGKSEFLFFYVSAQGRELSNLRDAFSGELQDLRSGFTRDAIPPLVRAGALIPVVDGFDELLGTAGYSGAFSSLQTLLADLEGLGALVVSARSAFYDLEFLERSSSPANDADISITTVSLHPWTDEQLHKYLGRDEDPQIARALDRLSKSDRDLLKRPFFASQFPSYVEDTAERDHSVNLLQYLITAYIEREAAKIVDASGDPVLPVDGHHRLFELTASEMWEAEARTLSVDDLRALTEIVAEEFGLGADQAVQLATKVTSYAGFRPGSEGRREEFSFEHEVYFDYFVTRALARFLGEGRFGELQSFLDRGVVPESVAFNAVRIALDSSPRISHELLQSPSGVRYDNRRRNFGALVAAYARVHPIEDATVRNLAFMDIAFHNANFRKTEFANCDFIGVDFEGATFHECVGATSHFHAISLDNSSHVDISGLTPGQNVGSIRHAEVGDLYAPDQVLEVLGRLGAPDESRSERVPRYSERAQVLIKLLHHVARAYRRTNIIYDDDTAVNLRRVTQSPFWPELKRILLETGVISSEIRPTSGSQKEALRLRIPVDQLLIGQPGGELPPGPAADLWKSMRNLE